MEAMKQHPHQALSAARIRAVKDPGRYADGNGLYLIVEPSGAKRWLLRTMVRGKRCDIGLGGLKVVSLAEAREKAASYRKLARNGGDPLEERRRQQLTVPTFAEAARRVHAEHGKTLAERQARSAVDRIRSMPMCFRFSGTGPSIRSRRRMCCERCLPSG